MSDGINRVILFGNLGADPELRRTPSGLSVLKVRLATNRSWKTREGVLQEHTEWHSVTIFGNRGEGLARVLRKGSYLFVEGHLHTYSYEKDGVRRYFTEVLADEVALGGRGHRSPEAQPERETDAEASDAAEAWADANVPAARSRSGEPLEMLAADERSAGEPPADGERPASHEPDLFEPRPAAPKPRRGEGGGGAAEVPLPPPRRKSRTPAGAPAMAAA